MDKLRAYNIISDQIDGLMIEEDRAYKSTGMHSQMRLAHIGALREAAKLLNWEVNCQFSVQEAEKNMETKNFKLIDRSVLIKALSYVDKEEFNFNTVCNIIRKVHSFDFQTEKELDKFVEAATQILIEEAKAELEAAEAAVPVADEIS